jgi:hypothetical protein
LLRDFLPASGCETPNAQVNRYSEGEQPCHGPCVPVKSRMRTLSSCPSWELVPGTSGDSGAESSDSLHVENDAVFLLNIAAHISATGVGVYVGQNKEPSGRRSSPSLECSLLPGLRGHQQQSR